MRFFLKSGKIAIITAIFTFIVTLSIYCYFYYLGQINSWIKNPIGADILWLVIAFGLWPIIKRGIVLNAFKFRISVWLLALFFALTFLVGHAFTLNGNLDMYSSKIGFLLFIFLLVGFAIIFGSLILIVFEICDRLNISTSSEHWIYTNKKRRLLTIWGLVFCCFSIYWMMLFPGVISYDSVVEINQIATNQYTDHHPFIHVVLLGSIMKIVSFFGGTLQIGIAIYSLLQMIIMSGIFAYTISFLIDKKINKVVIFLLVIYYALLPVQAIYSITMWKDVLFSGICLLIIIQLVKLFYIPSLIKDKLFFTALTVLFVLFSIFRHNGYYAFILFVPMLILTNLKYVRQYTLLIGLVFCLIFFYSKILLPSLHVQKGSVGEALSVPLQQIARTSKYDSATITSEEKKQIKEFLPTDSLAYLYNPHISDPVKAQLNNSLFEQNPNRFLHLWKQLFFKHPKTFFESAIAGSYGYYDPNVNCGGGYGFSTISDFDYEGFHFNSPYPKNSQAFGAKETVFLRAQKQIFIHVPLLSLLTSIGFIVWLGLIGATRLVIYKRKKLLLPFYLLGCLYLTILASPVYAEYRYAYAIVISIPFLLCIVLLNTEKLSNIFVNEREL